MKRTRQALEEEAAESPNFSQPSAPSSPAYNFDHLFRRVEPYWFSYSTFAKGRWFNRTLLDVFTREFRDRPRAYYEAATTAGLIRVNSEVVSVDYIIKQGDQVEHRIHRHEPPVLKKAVTIIKECPDAGFVVVEKPASVPMHPAGRFRYNSLVSIMKHENKHLDKHLSCVNRLDRLVSGICIMATDAAASDRLRVQMQGRMFRKFYIARLSGHLQGQASIPWALWDDDRTVRVEAPLLIVEHKLGLSTVADSKLFPAAKASCTHFYVLAYDQDTDSTLVLAEPITGRTHQIRLHAQHLGHPVRNDPLYNNQLWNSLKSPDTQSLPSNQPQWLEQVKELAQQLSKCPDMFPDVELVAGATSTCPDCENPMPDPDPERLRIDLHAFKYSSEEIGTFESPVLPSWCPSIEADVLEAGQVALTKLRE